MADSIIQSLVTFMLDLNEFYILGVAGIRGPAFLLYPSLTSNRALISELPFSLMLVCLNPTFYLDISLPT